MDNRMKNIKPDYKSKYHQSYYIPINKKKYNGQYPIIARSLLEKKMCRFLDLSPSILFWSSEPIAIKYINQWDNKQHIYYPDFVFIIDDKKVIVEVKPAKQLRRPKKPKKLTKKSIKNYNTSLQMYITNVSKVNAARKYASDNGYKFILVTEKELKNIFR
jgi:hypothetical protein